MNTPSSADPPFTPRKEFVRDLAAPQSSFSLLAISGSNCIRLYSFAPLAVASLRSLLQQSTTHILSSREDAVHNLIEYSLDGKPWANPKAVETEKLLVDIIAVIYRCGYAYLSTIDYGREADDRLIMAFSMTSSSPSTSRSLTPLPPSVSAKHDSSRSSIGDKPRVKRVPFAISFSSITVMRVISPPLHLTPAILQSVRGSWPRGVVAEKKVGDNSYEFKLKGYKWFQEDTFATDSLVHILALLTSLDSHSFTLLTSISLTNRSRVKDLWIFTGPVPEGGHQSEPSEQALADASLRLPPSPTAPHSESYPSPVNQTQHRRMATDPVLPTPQSPPFQHPRATTESPPRSRFPPQQPQVLRKPAPRAQVPVSVVQDSDIPDEPVQLRAHMPSTISSGVENMTGIGTGSSPKKFYTSSPFGDVTSTMPATSRAIVESPNARPSFPPSTPDRVKDAIPSSPSPASSTSHQGLHSPGAGHYLDRDPISSSNSVPVLPPLLPVGTFRDSAFSINSEVSCEVPIKWTGPLREELRAEQRNKPRRVSSGPNFPGGWQPTPIAERSEYEMRGDDIPQEENKMPVHEMLSRIDSPELVRPDLPLRKSEAAVVGIIPNPPVPLPPIPSTPLTGGGKGWVLIDVENGGSSRQIPSPGVRSNNQLGAQSSGNLAPSSSNLAPSSSNLETNTPVEQPSATAKAIVIMDAMDTKHKKSQSTSVSKTTKEGASGVRRFFSLSKKNSRKASDEDDLEPEKVASNSTLPRSNLRDRLRRIGTPEASRREDKRRSID